MFESVLVANRGEIARRVCRTLRRLGVTAVAVYTDADAGAPHVAEADVALRIGSYLAVDDVVGAAAAAGVSALHPGYGFLSERAALARAVQAAGIAWIGPPPAAIDAMGDKIRAKDIVAAAGVPVVPGAVDDDDHDDAALAAAAVAVGLPVLLKPSAGGGGKGMRRVDDPSALADEIAAARREALASFGDDTLLVERWVTTPRHIEIQVVADRHGHVVHLGERECSLQRRHQKVVEEAPSVLLDEATRAAMGASAVEAARSVGYEGVGTVELIVSSDRPDQWWFMEMNTRLQVEHPVTEAVTGVDLVEWQLRVAAGEPLPLTQDQVRLDGHAVEARIYAEDPGRGFLPSAGTVLALSEATGPGIRVDSGLAEGLVVGTGFDPMLAKVVAHGPDRATALARLATALRHTTILGLTTNTGWLARLVEHPDVTAGRLDTGLIARAADDLTVGEGGDAAVVAALALAAGLEPTPGPGPVDPWDIPGGWRLGPPAPATWRVRIAGVATTVAVTGRAGDASVAVDGGTPVAASWVDGTATIAGRASPWSVARRGAELWVGHAGDAWRVVPDDAATGGTGPTAGQGGPVGSPMPGTVLAVHVAEGDPVEAGDRLVTVEAMKMEHVVVAPVAGTVGTLAVTPGQAVTMDQTLAVVLSRPPEAT